MKINTDKLQLRPVPAGYKVKYQHFYKTTDGRPLFQDGDAWFIATTGGASTYYGTRVLFATDAWLEDSTGERVVRASAICNPKDTPNKKLGRAIAHNRCIKNFHNAV